MGLFGKKNLEDYKILDIVNPNRTEINIDEALRTKEKCGARKEYDKCKFVFEDMDYQYYLYYASIRYHLLKRQKKKNRIVYLGKAEDLACYFHEKIFTISSFSMFSYDRNMKIIDCKTGERKQADFLGKGDVFAGGSAFCQDRVLKMGISIDRQAIELIIRREKAEFPKDLQDPFNDDLVYKMKIVFENGKFAATPITSDAIIKRGPWPKYDGTKETNLARVQTLDDLEQLMNGKVSTGEDDRRSGKKEPLVQTQILGDLSEAQMDQILNEVNEELAKKKAAESIKQTEVQAEKKKATPSQDIKKNLQTKKYWIADNGTVKCLDKDCPAICSMECPIYVQTLGLECLMRNDFKGAEKHLKKAVEIEPSFADAWNNLAACYGQMGEHKNAFMAYQRSYDILQKPNPLYGMAVASKNMEDYVTAEKYVQKYIGKFDSDKRILSLEAEIAERQLSAKLEAENEKKNTIVMEENSDPVTEKQVMHEENSSAMESTSVLQKPEITIEDMQRFGKYMLLLLDPDTREAGYDAMKKMEDGFPEASIILGQYYNGINVEEAKKHFRKAAEKGIAEAQWSYSQLLPHSHILDFSDAQDKEYLKYCLAAAEGGCSDAANEMGNICHRKEYYEESTYWYGMAYCLEHPSGMLSMRGITKEWQQKGVSKVFQAHLEGFTEERRATALLIYEMFTHPLSEKIIDDLMILALKGENLAGFIAAKIYEEHNNDDMAYKVYNALAFEYHPYALRCYADMLMAGKGTERDVGAALRIYEKAAKGGNTVAMFVMGQKAVKDGDKYLAACWFGQAYSRGFEMAGDWLSKLADN